MMPIRRSCLFLWTIVMAASSSLAFTAAPTPTRLVTRLAASPKDAASPKPVARGILPLVTLVTMAPVWMAQAVEVMDDGYEYGAVDAPIGIAVAGGVLAILTALLPIALRGGEEAFEEIKDRDQDSFGKRNDVLKSKRK